MILGESAGVAAAMAACSEMAIQDVPYEALKTKLLELGQILERSGTHVGWKETWASKEEWDKDKEGYEWVFFYIDKNKDGKVTLAEYSTFQAFKKKHNNWEKALRQSGQL